MIHIKEQKLKYSMLFLLFSCTPEDPQITGVDLLNHYNGALCDVMSQSECGVALANCGSSVVIFPSHEACMNARHNLSEGCETLEENVLNAQEVVNACIETLEIAASVCSESSLCPNGVSVVKEGACAEVEDIFKQCNL